MRLPAALAAAVAALPTVAVVFFFAHRRGVSLKTMLRGVRSAQRKGSAPNDPKQPGQQQQRITQANRPSLTAEFVAMMRASLTRSGLLDDHVAFELLDSDARLLVRLTGWAKQHQPGSVHGRTPLVLSVLARTLVLDEAIARVAPKQVVLLGAGLDARPYRLSMPDTKFYEVDAPSTQAQKRALVDRALRRRRDVFTSAHDEHRVVFASCDFSSGESFMDKLLASGFDANNPSTVFVFEGVSMYLSNDDVRATLESVSSRCAAGTTFLIHVFSDRAVRGSTHSAILADIGEVLKWGMSESQSAEDGFGGMGFRAVNDTVLAPFIAQRFGEDAMGGDVMYGTNRVLELQVR